MLLKIRSYIEKQVAVALNSNLQSQFAVDFKSLVVAPYARTAQEGFDLLSVTNPFLAFRCHGHPDSSGDVYYGLYFFEGELHSLQGGPILGDLSDISEWDTMMVLCFSETEDNVQTDKKTVSVWCVTRLLSFFD